MNILYNYNFYIYIYILFILSVTLSLSKQYAEEGITFVPVHPGEVDTDMMRAALGTNKQLIEEAAKLTVSPEVSVRSQLEVCFFSTFIHEIRGNKWGGQIKIGVSAKNIKLEVLIGYVGPTYSILSFIYLYSFSFNN
jgi:hypothetical protein